MKWIPTTLSHYEEIIDLNQNTIGLDTEGWLRRVEEDSVSEIIFYTLREKIFSSSPADKFRVKHNKKKKLFKAEPVLGQSIDLLAVYEIEGMSIRIDFATNTRNNAFDIFTQGWEEFPFMDEEPRFILLFSDGQELEFEARTPHECFDWMYAICLVITHIDYYEKLPFVRAFKEHQGSMKNRIAC